MTATPKGSTSDREILLVGPYGVLGRGLGSNGTVNRLKDLGTGHPTPPLRFAELATLHGRRLRVRRTSSVRAC
jgi:hypothetical protein